MAKFPFVTFVAVVTDNTATNQLVWSTLQQKRPKVFFHGCVSHAIHLIVKDLVNRLPWLKTLESDCRQLVRFLKKNQQKRLQQMDGRTALVMPADTYWGTIERCFSSILTSEAILHAFVNSRGVLRGRTKEQKAKRRHAHDMVVANDFVKKLEKAIALLSVLSAFQKAFERNTTPPSEVYHTFLELPKIYRIMELPIADLGRIAQIVDERFNFIYGDAHGVAYRLDPRFLGREMDATTREKVDDFIIAWHGAENEDAAAVELLKYLGMPRTTSREVKLIEDKQLAVLEYWRGMSQFPLLREIALVVFSATCSSAAAERNFSAHKFVHSQAPNRVRDSTVLKLVFMFFNMKNFNDDDRDFYDMFEDLGAV